jgi:hypothetical protein
MVVPYQVCNMGNYPWYPTIADIDGKMTTTTADVTMATATTTSRMCIPFFLGS